MADDKKKKKPSEDDNPFNFDEDTMNQINEQIRKIFEGLASGKGLPPEFNQNEPFAKMLGDMFKQLGDPSKIANMTPEELQKRMKQFGGPFIWGMNMNFGPDGMPRVDSFGNVKPKKTGDTEVSTERDPLIDTYEDGDQLVVVAEVPGVQKEDIELRAAPTELEILAESQDEGPKKRKYRKVVPLPQEINPDIAKARYQNGILEVRLTMIGEKKKPKKIDID